MVWTDEFSDLQAVGWPMRKRAVKQYMALMLWL